MLGPHKHSGLAMTNPSGTDSDSGRLSQSLRGGWRNGNFHFWYCFRDPEAPYPLSHLIFITPVGEGQGGLIPKSQM